MSGRYSTATNLPFRRAGIVALVVLFVVPVTGSTQEAMWPGDIGALHPFAGFGGVEWGAHRSKIVETWGEPDRSHELGDGTATALIYPNVMLAGEESSLGFLIHPDHGLTRGQALFPYGEGEDCWRLFTRIRNLVDAALPEDEPAAQIDRGPEDLSFCTAFLIGAAEARVLWSDPDSGARISLMLDLSDGVLRLSYESPSFVELVREGRSGPR